MRSCQNTRPAVPKSGGPCAENDLHQPIPPHPPASRLTKSVYEHAIIISSFLSLPLYASRVDVSIQERRVGPDGFKFFKPCLWNAPDLCRGLRYSGIAAPAIPALLHRRRRPRRAGLTRRSSCHPAARQLPVRAFRARTWRWPRPPRSCPASVCLRQSLRALSPG